MQLHVEPARDGAPILFLHGVAGSSRTYDWLSVDGHRLDFRGHGASDRAPGTYRLDGYVADALSVLERIAPATLVGHSLGGCVAWTVAQRRPELVRGAFLEDPPLYMGEPDGHAGNPAIPAFTTMRAETERWQAEGIDEATAAARLAAQPYGPDPSRTAGDVQTPEALESRAYALLHLDLEVLDRVIDGSLLAATDTASPVAVPVLVLAADDAFGAAFPTAHERRLAASHPEVEVVRLPGAGHSIHDGRASRAAYAEQLERFLTR
ncbi:MAG TPA: alpha/beta hydrolase [Solirubrobacter sp.]|nr:alpha/beta hydrolase [Solirubrobacter sp.]